MAEGSHAAITVTDTGQGIPNDFLPHIFEAFSQVDASSLAPKGTFHIGAPGKRRRSSKRLYRGSARRPSNSGSPSMTIRITRSFNACSR
jgi:hypothetical protein